MQPWQYVIFIFSGLGIFNSLAFVLYLQLSVNKGPDRRIFLQIILLAYILQILHALLETFDFEYSSYISNLYLIGSYLQGPAMYLLIRKTVKPDLQIWPHQFDFNISHRLFYLEVGAEISYWPVNTGIPEEFRVLDERYVRYVPSSVLQFGFRF